MYNRHHNYYCLIRQYREPLATQCTAVVCSGLPCKPNCIGFLQDRDYCTASSAILGARGLAKSAPPRLPLGAGAAYTLRPASTCSCAPSWAALMVTSGRLRLPPVSATSSYDTVPSLCGSTALVPDRVPAGKVFSAVRGDHQTMRLALRGDLWQDEASM